MRICLVGDVSGNLDEGMKKVTASLAKELRKRNVVHVFDPTKPFRLSAWTAIRRFRPEIVHYVSGPSTVSFVIAQMLSLLSDRIPVVMSAIHPRYLWPRRLLRVLRPNLLLVQSHRVARLLSSTGSRIRYLPLGVDVEVFRPPSSELKRSLRKKYSIKPDSFVILHVGNLRENRNLRTLANLKEEGTEVIIVGSTSVRSDHRLVADLRAKGLRIWDQYLPDVHEVYQLADLYIFPVRSPVNAIEFPLSVLEAMATNLPVICTPFGGLPQFLRPTDGFVWLDDDAELEQLVSVVRDGRGTVDTRSAAMRFSWHVIGRELEMLYAEALSRVERA